MWVTKCRYWANDKIEDGSPKAKRLPSTSSSPTFPTGTGLWRERERERSIQYELIVTAMPILLRMNGLSMLCVIATMVLLSVRTMFVGPVRATKVFGPLAALEPGRVPEAKRL